MQEQFAKAKTALNSGGTPKIDSYSINKTGNYIDAAGSYVRDFASGNMAAIFLGSYTVTSQVISNRNGVAVIRMVVENKTDAGSLMHYTGYGAEAFWNAAAERLPGDMMNPVTQTFVWDETINYGG